MTQAKLNNVSNAYKSNLLAKPSFNNLLIHFPRNANGGEMTAENVYNLIGGKVLEAYQNDPIAYGNACALRVSRALNGCSVNLPNIRGKTMKGADDKNYFYRAKDLFDWLSQSYGKPTSTTNYSSLSGKKGIYVMQAHYPAHFGAWGHATLYNMTGTVGNSYEGSYAYRYNLWEF
jgi:hypothetical protein